MTIETLVKANRVAKELERWRDIDTRLQCGTGVFKTIYNTNGVKDEKIN